MKDKESFKSAIIEKIMDNGKIASNIIDNSSERELVSVVKDQLEKSKEAKFAIGYFFLSGFSLVKDNFPDKYDNLPFLKLIMGNETTHSTKEELVAGYSLRESLKQRMIEDLQKIKLTEDQIKQIRTLKEFIANNIIDVKLFEISRLHAKLYLFLSSLCFAILMLVAYDVNLAFANIPSWLFLGLGFFVLFLSISAVYDIIMGLFYLNQLRYELSTKMEKE